MTNLNSLIVIFIQDSHSQSSHSEITLTNSKIEK